MRRLPLNKTVYINIVGRKPIIRFLTDPGDIEKTPVVKRCYPFLGGHQKQTFMYEVEVTKKEAIEYMKRYAKEYNVTIPPHIFTKMDNPRKQTKRDYSHTNYKEVEYSGGDMTEVLLDIPNSYDQVAITTKQDGVVTLRMTVDFAKKHKLDTVQNLSPYGLYTKNLLKKNTRFTYSISLSPIVCYFLADILKGTHLNLAMRLLSFSDMQIYDYVLDPTSKKSLWHSELPGQYVLTRSI